ncbi:hypothetical protein AB0368_36680 [Actinoplanes sp. NPDC051475]|uniref:hypothetical protein n=1 Tax=Actinoplanes sp. NPDC051475 TaxID=3157225 RepID=UPI00344C166C
MSSKENVGAAGLLSRLGMLVQATVLSPGDTTLLELALVQAVAAIGADCAMLGIRRREVLDVTLLSGAGGATHDMGILQVGSRYPLTDAIVQERSIWLSSPPEIRSAYPSAGGLWGRAIAVVPLMLRHCPVGAIAIIHETAVHHHCGSERLFLTAVADICATMVADPQGHPWTTTMADQTPPP